MMLMIPKLQQHKMFEVIQGTRPIQANSFRPLHRAPKHGNTAMFLLGLSQIGVVGGENCGGFRDDLFDVFFVAHVYNYDLNIEHT